MKAQFRFKGRLLVVVTQRVRLPNGRYKTIEKIIHPGAVLIVPFVRNNHVILLRQFRPAFGEYLYEFPAGTLGKRESPDHCAMRELREETGFKAGFLRKVGVLYPAPGYATEKIYVYRASRLTESALPQDEDEIITSKTVSLGKMRQMVRQGKIKDSKTLAALALCGILVRS